MNPLNLDAAVQEAVEVNRADRWQVYLRLQDLGIPCECPSDQPLRVQIQSATAAMQLWSVVKQLTASRQDLVEWLERCFDR
ncbi:hypothetical protein H6F77_23925 [Microcoleus sp. FACHB-831]|uniref:Asr1405/Asl0597 family protein n=1 Tax=Microcoleus sp. FACHB-831 TaxID=2692827 RepID=UPI0016831C91|nr:Asr1405/Asl0597 family protein [Microcoleus sp. FACHB-831]MBD1924094.1 hypothetical protein [Microcoleus sp. FACHB-831]